VKASWEISSLRVVMFSYDTQFQPFGHGLRPVQPVISHFLLHHNGDELQAVFGRWQRSGPEFNASHSSKDGTNSIVQERRKHCRRGFA
jgi:hypothetical protein